MADTTFTDYSTPAISASWLNDVNDHVYNGLSLDGISLANVKDPTYGAKGDGTTDDTLAIQSAITANAAVYFPPGVYKITSKIIMRTDSIIIGDGLVSRIKGTHSGTIFEYPINNNSCVVRNLTFSGVACTGVAVATTAGSLQGYLTQFNCEECRFWYEMDFGINAQMLLCHIRDTFFGHEGASFNTTNGFVGIKAYAYYQNVNLNRVMNCSFQNTGGGGSNKYAMWIYGATSFLIDNCDFEGNGGRSLYISQGGLHEIRNCWFERNGSLSPNTPSAASSIILVESTYDQVTFTKCTFSAGGCNSTNSYIESNGTGQISIKDCTFDLEAGQYPFYNNASTSYLLDGAGKLTWRRNYVTNGNASNKLVTNLNFGEVNNVRFWAIINTASSGTILASSDPNVSISRTGTGVVEVTFSSPFCSNANYGCVIASAQLGQAWASAVTTTKATIQCKNSSGVAQDDIFHVVVFGK